MTVTITKDMAANVLRRVRDLTNKRVLIGIPQSADARDDGSPVGNAVRGYINEFGDPERNIPARPFLIPGVAAVQDKSIARLKKAGEAALLGGDPQPEMMKAGLGAQGSVKSIIEAGIAPALSERTLRGRIASRKTGHVGSEQELKNRAAGLAPSTDLSKPLIDTGELLNSILYVIEDKRDA
ncbi:MAG: hypothetical protein ACRYGR_07145 [Janthinobacterium lividum]